ncbi:MAG TPA: ABC transporter substrate-binding protein [Azospirillaceae bacterium]|nr:ABC transporter substrate-binding protein [Azospirillaceae bacterium]
MILILRIACLAAALVLAAASARAEALPRLVMNTEEDPPYNFTDPSTGGLSGIAGELVPMVLKRAGIEYEIRMLPWRRAYETAQRQPNTCVFAINLTEERRPLFKWVTPVAKGGWTLFGRQDWTRQVRSLEDIRDVPVVAQAGSGIEALLVDSGIQVVPVTALPTMMPMLANRRADLVAIGATNGPWLARQAGVELQPVLRLSTTELGIACSLTTDDRLVDRMHAALRQLRAEGVVDEIAKRYE